MATTKKSTAEAVEPEAVEPEADEQSAPPLVPLCWQHGAPATTVITRRGSMLYACEECRG